MKTIDQLKAKYQSFKHIEPIRTPFCLDSWKAKFKQVRDEKTYGYLHELSTYKATELLISLSPSFKSCAGFDDSSRVNVLKSLSALLVTIQDTGLHEEHHVSHVQLLVDKIAFLLSEFEGSKRRCYSNGLAFKWSTHDSEAAMVKLAQLIDASIE